MKVALGHKIQEGPWGGGNNFATTLSAYLQDRGHRVVFTLDDIDIDIIILTDPRYRNPGVNFTAGQISRYLMFRNPQAIVVHRINECDERKNTRSINARLRLANYCADHTVFIASWLQDLRVWCRTGHQTTSVILNGGDRAIFNDLKYEAWDGTAPLKLVTHHWGGNRMKGFDVYEQVDAMISRTEWMGKIEFTYIGNLPPGVEFKNTTVIKPDHGTSLAHRLMINHVYLTASICEPGGMHHIEGALCGLPLLYRNSGALPEYCSEFGEVFDGPETFEQALHRMMKKYSTHRNSLSTYPHSGKKMAAGFLSTFEFLVANRGDIVSKRNMWRNPVTQILNQFPI